MKKGKKCKKSKIPKLSNGQLDFSRMSAEDLLSLMNMAQSGQTPQGASPGVTTPVQQPSTIDGELRDISAVAGSLLSMPTENPNVGAGTIGGALNGFAAGGPFGAVLGAGMGFINSGNKKAALEEQNRKRERDLLLASKVSPQYMEDGGKAEGNPLVPVQTEKGELFFNPATLEILDVNADKKHEYMEDDEVTDLLPVDSEVLSNSLKLDPSKMSDEEDFMGFGMSYYDETGKNKMLYKKKLSSVIGTKKDTFANHLESIRDVFSTVEDTYDIFDQRTNEENKKNRVEYIGKLISLQREMNEDKVEEPIQTFKWGGKVKKYADGDPVTLEELMKYFQGEFSNLKEDVNNQVGSQISDYNAMYGRSKNRNALGLATDVFAGIAQDPREDPFIETPFAIDERFRSTPIAITESQASRINRSPISTGRDLIAAGANPADVPSMIAKLQQNAVDATSNLYANQNKLDADLREKKYAELARISSGNDARTTAAANAERTNRNRIISGIGRGVGNYLSNADAIDYSNVSDVNNIYNDYLNTRGNLIESESNLLSPMATYNEYVDDYDRRRANLEKALYGNDSNAETPSVSAKSASGMVPGIGGIPNFDLPQSSSSSSSSSGGNVDYSSFPYPLRRAFESGLNIGNEGDFDFYQNNPDLWKFPEYAKRIPRLKSLEFMKNPRFRRLLLNN